MTELISRQAALYEIDKNRDALLSSGMTGAEHILVHYGRRVIEELPAIDVTDTNVGDLISRQALKNALTNWQMEYAEKDKDTERFETLGAVIVLVEQMPTAEPKRGKWIPCSERLPEVNERCLCTYEFNEGTCVDFGLYTKRGWFVSGVTAWMPLPEPYKAERSE